MRADTVSALSAKLTNLDHIDLVIGELEDRQKWLLKYIDLKRQEHHAARQQSDLRLTRLINTIDRLLVLIDDKNPGFVDACAKITACTLNLYELDGNKKTTQKLIGELERVGLLRESVGRVELALFDCKQFGAAAAAIKMIADLQVNLCDSEAAKVWIEKAKVTVPLVHKAAMDAIKTIFRESASEMTTNNVAIVQSACTVISNDPESRRIMIDWLATLYLADYTAVYCNPQSTEPELCGLGSLESRLSWLTRVLHRLDHVATPAIPTQWHLDAAVIDRFAQLTRRSLSRAIDLERQRAPNSLPTLLKAAINNAISYERHLQVSRPQAFGQDFFFLMPAFEAHLGVFIDVHERGLSKFMGDLLKDTSALLAKKRSQRKFTAIPHDDRHIAQSAETLTQLFKAGLSEVSKLTTGAVLGGLADIFQAALRDYCRYLMLEVQRIHGKQATCDGARVESACVLINTIDYLLETVKGMEATFRKVLGRVSRVQIDFTGNVHGLQQYPIFWTQNEVVQVTAKVLMACTAEVWVELAKGDMGRCKSTVHDQSPYVNMLIGELVGPPFAQLRRLITFPERHRWVCEAFVANLLSKFESTVRDTRPINHLAAEQLLIDLQTLRPLLTTMHLPDPAFKQHVDRMLTGVERTYKILLHDAKDPDAFVAHYYLMSDGEGREEVFRRVLELKGIVRDGMTAVAGTVVGRERYLEAFRKHQPPPPAHIHGAIGTASSDKRSIRSRFANLFT